MRDGGGWECGAPWRFKPVLGQEQGRLASANVTLVCIGPNGVQCGQGSLAPRKGAADNIGATAQDHRISNPLNFGLLKLLYSRVF